MRYDTSVKVVHTSPFEKRIDRRQYEKVGIVEPYICTVCNRVWQHAGATSYYMEYLVDFPKRGCSKNICKRCDTTS